MSFNVTKSNFQTEVIERSKTIPILVDFWAEWCGPCRMLTPLLEKLEKDYNGRFLLVKINTDENPDLAQQFQITGIPSVKLIVNGEEKDKFTGALPELQLKNFLDRNLPNKELEEIYKESIISPISAAQTIIEKNIQDEKSEEILFRAVLYQIKENLPENEWLPFLIKLPEIGSSFSDARGHLLSFLKRNSGTEVMGRLGQLLQNERSRDTLEYFLQRFETGENKEDLKNDLVCCFLLLNNRGDLVNEYRRKLAKSLF